MTIWFRYKISIVIYLTAFSIALFFLFWLSTAGNSEVGILIAIIDAVLLFLSFIISFIAELVRYFRYRGGFWRGLGMIVVLNFAGIIIYEFIFWILSVWQ